MTTKLYSWLKEQKKHSKDTGFSMQNFAAEIGIHRVSLWAIANGKGTSLERALRIESATYGAVRPGDLIRKG